MSIARRTSETCAWVGGSGSALAKPPSSAGVSSEVSPAVSALLILGQLVVVHSGTQGPRYSVRAPDGRLLAPEMSFAQLAGIYGEGGTIETWSQVLEHEIPGCYSDEIVRFSPRQDSGAYRYFIPAVLGSERDARGGSRPTDDPKDLVERVKKNPCAIGYASVAHVVEHVKLACVAAGGGDAGDTGNGEPHDHLLQR